MGAYTGGGHARGVEPGVVEVDLTAAQLAALASQWGEHARNRPTDLHLTVGGQPVGVLHVVSALLVTPSP